MRSIFSLICCIAASEQSEAISAPTYPWVSAAIYRTRKVEKRSAQGKEEVERRELDSTHLLEINVVSQLHVLGVNPEDLESTSGVGDSDVDLSIEPSESSKSRVDGVGSVGSSHNDDVGSSLQRARVVSFEKGEEERKRRARDEP